MEQNNLPEEVRNKSWLEEISQQSWNPELIISGIAIYATFNLPQIFEKLYNNYFSHYQLNESVGNAIMPLLIYSVLVSISQILSIAFIIHFVLRAFWVGYLGVLSVFPKGIDFDKITLYGDYGIEQLRKKMKNLDVLAMQLDKAASIVFALAILVVLQFVGIAFAYFVIALTHNLFQNLLSKDVYQQYQDIIQWSLLSLVMIPGFIILVLNTKYFRNHPVYGKWQYNASTTFQRFFLPVFSTHIQSLLLTFNSGVSRQKIMWISLVLGFVFGGMIIFNVINTKASRLVETRHFYSSYSSEKNLVPNYYEDKRSEKDIRVATIQSDIIKEPYVRLFIAYPKRTDEFLDSLYRPTGNDKKRNRYQNRLLKDQQNLKYLEDFYRIEVNDSLLTKKEFMYYEFPEGDKGVMMYIPVSGCKSGKNQIKITARKNYEPDYRPYECLIHFWY